MALTSTLGSPGIEIREVDNSIRIDSSTSTTVFVPGFAAQGPVEEVISIGTISDFELIYGKPTNGAERYFYYTVKALLDKGGSGCRVLTSRLPYGGGLGDTVSDAYTLLAYPAIPIIKKQHTKNNKTFTVDSDCFLFTSNLDDIFKLVKTSKTNSVAEGDEDGGNNEYKLEKTKSSYDFFIEENYIKTNSIEKLTFAISPIDLGKISVESDVEQTNVTIKIDDDKYIYGKGKVSTELKNGILYANLSLGLYDDNGDVTVKVGMALFRLGFSLAGDSYDTETYTYSIGEITDTELKLYEAYEIAVSYDGQSKAQLGSWSDVTTVCPEGDDEKVIEDSLKFSKDVTYLLGAPATFQVSLKEYYKILTGEFIKWSRRPYTMTDEKQTVYETTKDKKGSESCFGLIEALGHSAFITINTSRSTVNESFEGYYLGVTDNTFTTPSDDYIFNAVTGVKITTDTYETKNNKNEDGDVKKGLIDSVEDDGDFATLGTQRLSFKLDSNNQGSLSRVMSRDITNKDISSTEFDDTLSLGLFKLTKTTDSNDTLKLNYSLREKYNWSFSKSRLKSDVNSSKPVSYFADNVMENSNNLGIMINPYISEKDFVTIDGNFHGKIRVFGDKLVGNLDNYENKYLARTYTPSTETSAIKPAPAHKLAKSNIDSYKALIAQAGLTPSILRNFKHSAASSAIDGYKTFSPINSLYPVGTYSTAQTAQKVIGQVPSKLSRALALVENDEQYPDIDILVEGGLGTIFMYSNGNEISGEFSSRSVIADEDGNNPIKDEDSDKIVEFDESVILTGIEDMRTSRSSLSEDAEDVIQDYLSVTNVFLQFANSMQNGGRGDTFFISDVPRGILIKGKDTKITNLYGVDIENSAYELGETVVHSFPTSVYYPIKHQFDNVVSTYASTYAQWVKIYDDATGEKVWIPISGHIAATMASTDAVYGPWYAAAGLRRGVIDGVLDYAISPTISQRTDLYKICINSVPKIPNYGVTIWGIRTMGKKDSAFDQNTCRRTFLYMEKKIKQLMRYYLFEPNTSYTRLQIFNDIDPFLEGIKNNGGIYSYTLVCDNTVNTPEIINNGDLVVAIAAAPTRTAENIIVEFTANKYTEEIASAESLS